MEFFFYIYKFFPCVSFGDCGGKYEILSEGQGGGIWDIYPNTMAAKIWIILNLPVPLV